MSNIGLNIFDWAVLFIIIASTVSGGMQGLGRELFSLIAFTSALFLTARYGSILEGPTHKIIDNEWAAKIASRLMVFMFFSMLFGYLGILLSDLMRRGMSNFFDRVLGVFFGLIRGLLVILVPFVAIDLFVTHDMYPSWFTESRSYPFLDNSAKMLEKYLPPRREHNKFNKGDVKDVQHDFHNKTEGLKSDATDLKEKVVTEFDKLKDAATDEKPVKNSHKSDK